jgi:hypothetical protein
MPAMPRFDSPLRALVTLLTQSRKTERFLLFSIHERLKHMSTTDDLNAAVAVIKIAVGDAANAIKDLADKLAASSSVNPADVETAANQLTAIAKGLESVVAAAGEPVTAEPPAEPSTGEATTASDVGSDTMSSALAANADAAYEYNAAANADAANATPPADDAIPPA